VVDTALSATSETLQTYLQQQLAATVPFFAAATMEVSLSDPREMADSGRQGVSLWLYRVARDDQRLNAPPRRLAADRLEPVPLPLRLHYLVSPVTNLETATVGTRQTILGRVLQSLYEHPAFRGAELRGDLAGTDAELYVRLEPMAVDEIARIWEALDHGYQLSVSYESSIVYIRSTRAAEQVHPVEVLVPEWGLASVVGAGEGP
jgi:hypothetical protein